MLLFLATMLCLAIVFTLCGLLYIATCLARDIAAACVYYRRAYCLSRQCGVGLPAAVLSPLLPIRSLVRLRSHAAVRRYRASLTSGTVDPVIAAATRARYEAMRQRLAAFHREHSH
jgi:hypothetical protein